ncbi:MAG: hypothetical protein JHC98_05010 [Thermoleophilaceae bacterium]|nr:hypothetical protein [Thermoleophilaceae bacterium]
MLARLLVVTTLLGLMVAGTAAAADESAYAELPAQQQAVAPPSQSTQASGEWLPACSPRIVIAAVFKMNHRVHVIGYVKRSMIGHTLRIQARLAGGATVVKFKPRRNGYFDVEVRRPRHRVARRAAWRVAFGGYRTQWVKLYRPLVLNNVHQRKGLLMVNGQLNVPARDDTVIAVQRLDDCHTATRIGQMGLPIDGTGLLNGGIQLRDLFAPVATFVRLRVRVRERATGAWGKSFWSLPLPVVLTP